MDYDKLVTSFSNGRINKYLASIDISHPDRETKAIEVYEGNILLSKSFHPLISILEVALRNGINQQLCLHFGSNNWLLEQKTGFMIDQRLTYRDYLTRVDVSDNFFREKVQEAEAKLISRRLSVSHNKLLAELSFGFWTKLFDAKPIKVLAGKQLMAFKSGTRISSTEVYEILNKIRLFRNRISHHEPICFDVNGKFCLRKTVTMHFKIKEVIRWLGTDIRDWSEKFDTVYEDLKKSNMISSHPYSFS